MLIDGDARVVLFRHRRKDREHRGAIDQEPGCLKSLIDSTLRELANERCDAEP